MNTVFTKEKYFSMGQVPRGIGAVLDGWNILEDDYTNPLIARRVADLRVMTSKCPHDCFHCFTDKSKSNLSLDEIKNVINQLADIHVKAIDFLGEGEPTLDKNFFEILEYTKSKGIQPIIFTDAATKLTDISFVKRLKEIGVTVCPKCDSLLNEEYQNRVVGDKTGTYFRKRNEAIQLLMQEGFNDVREDGSTRLGFDMVVTKKNIHEVEATLRYCRDNNMRVVFCCFLPSGRSGKEEFDQTLSLNEEDKKNIAETVKRVDAEYGFIHKIPNNFFTAPCVEFLQVCGNGDVTPCPGNEHVVGNIKTENIVELRKRILEKFSLHDCKTFSGNCIYRKPII